MARREFQLPEADEEFLRTLGLAWETIRQADRRWLIIYQMPLPTGFATNHANVAIEILAGYPPGHLDMAYFSPTLERADRKPMPQTQHIEKIDGTNWQRWSRHRTGECPWIAGEDSLETHIDFVKTFLEREPKR